ncbi:complement component C8 gamma chain [Leuresthes tenuis]|uniref:complement component C8 gamma chain n=1 Tax=Leuresthes tenuis TaxID=355514 RepID=UPI003B502337
MTGASRCMLTVVVLVCVCLLGPADALGGAKSRPRPQRRPKKPKVEPVDKTPPAQDIDIGQMTGKWYLINTASKCPLMIKRATNMEPTVLTLTSLSDQALSVSTKTRHNHQCWEILQVYHLTSTKGRLTLKGANPELDTAIVIGETDYTSYAVMFYQKRGKVTVKLYTRSPDNLSEPTLTKFEELAEKHGLGLAYVFGLPTYSHCEDVDQDHVINCVPSC